MPFNLADDLTQRREAGLYRQTKQLRSAQGPNVETEEGSFLAFCSNDYLGLAADPRLADAFHQATKQYGFGAGAAHLVNGHFEVHEALESELARWTGREAAVLFSTGYMANMGVISALLDKQDAVFQDKWNHASLLDGGFLSGARSQRYLHKDLDNLETKLLRSDARRKLIVTDGVFSMDGDKANLSALSSLAKQHDAWLMVDDAHGMAALGETGAGLCEEQGVTQNDVAILMGTLGKGFGTAGAFVAGSQLLIDYLKNFARQYIYTTAMPPALAASTLTSLKIIETEPERRDHLNRLVMYFRKEALAMGINLMDSDTAIQPVLIGDAEQALSISASLKQKGILVPAIRPPTVPAGTARLRITLSASHTVDHVNQLLDGLGALSISIDNASKETP